MGQAPMSSPDEFIQCSQYIKYNQCLNGRTFKNFQLLGGNGLGGGGGGGLFIGYCSRLDEAHNENVDC